MKGGPLSVNNLFDVKDDVVEYQKNRTSIYQMGAREIINAGILSNLMLSPTDGYLKDYATEKYVDDAIKNIDIPDAGNSFNPGDQVAKTNGTNVEVGGFYVNLGNLYVRVS